MWNQGQKPEGLSDVTFSYLKTYHIWNQKNTLSTVLEDTEYHSPSNPSEKHRSKMKDVISSAVVMGLCLCLNLIICLKLKICSNLVSWAELQCCATGRREYFHHCLFIHGASVLLACACLHGLHNLLERCWDLSKPKWKRLGQIYRDWLWTEFKYFWFSQIAL